MNALFVALGIMVLALLALLLWFVPHLLQQQASTVAKETDDLRKILLDVLNEQRRLTDSEFTYLDARVQVARALADLERLTGGLLP